MEKQEKQQLINQIQVALQMRNEHYDKEKGQIVYDGYQIEGDDRDKLKKKLVTLLTE